MKISVTHEVSPDATRCSYGGDFFGKDVCRYYACRNRTHGRKAPAERNIPKCILFNTWLDRPFTKCSACIDACRATREECEVTPHDI